MNLSEIFEAEPNLKTIADRARSQRRNSYRRRISAYESIKGNAAGLVGWGARNPLLQTDDAWILFIRHVAKTYEYPKQPHSELQPQRAEERRISQEQEGAFLMPARTGGRCSAS